MGNTRKQFREDRTCSSEDMIADRQTRNTQTDRHAHHNTPLPHRGRSNKICRQQFIVDFNERRYAGAVFAAVPCLSVCPSVRP